MKTKSALHRYVKRPEDMGVTAQEPLVFRADEAFAEQMLSQSLAPVTWRKYQRAVEVVARATGGCRARHFIRYMALEQAKGKNARAASTLRNIKAGLVFHAFRKRNPFTAIESLYCDRVLDGYEVFKGVRKQRAGLDEEMFDQFLEYARSRDEHDVADGFEVLAAACVRPRDIERLTTKLVSQSGDVIWAELKLRRMMKVRLGWVEPRPVTTAEAQLILQARVRAFAGRPDACLFPKFHRCGLIIKEAAVKFGWPEGVLWTGAHNARYTSARAVVSGAVAAAREKGKWRGQDGPLRYGIRGHPDRPRALQAVKTAAARRYVAK